MPYVFDSQELHMSVAIDADSLPDALLRFLSSGLDQDKFTCDRFPGMTVGAFMTGARAMFAEA